MAFMGQRLIEFVRREFWEGANKGCVKRSLLAVEAAEGDGCDEGEDPDEERDGEEADLHPVNALCRLDRRAALELGKGKRLSWFYYQQFCNFKQLFNSPSRLSEKETAPEFNF